MNGRDFEDAKGEAEWRQEHTGGFLAVVVHEEAGGALVLQVLEHLCIGEGGVGLRPG